MDDIFGDLAKKWLHLKEKNIEKLKNQYEESKNKFNQEESFQKPRRFESKESSHSNSV